MPKATQKVQYDYPKDDGSLAWYDSYYAKIHGGHNPQERQQREQKEIEEQELLQLEEAMQVELPQWPDNIRCVPNSTLRGSLFAAIQERDSDLVENLVIHNSGSLLIKYTGRRLTQSDLDVWEQCLHLVKGSKLGNRAYIDEAKFIRDMGRTPGGPVYKWLRNTLTRLSHSGVEIDTDKFRYVGSMIQEYFFDKQRKQYYIVVNPRLGRLYKSGHTYVDFEARKRIGKQKPLALWLHGYISSHTKWVPHKVETLKEYSGSKTNSEKKFKQNLKVALELLLSLQLIENFDVTRNGLVYINMVTNPQT